MIKTLEIADWEGYKYASIHFSPGTNTIIGLSHYGKSSIVRAINFVLENKPSGTPYFPHKKENPQTEVSIDFTDNQNISRIRSASKNLYSIGDKTFTALRSGVPDEVRNISNMLERNVQSQKDVHFFLTETPGKRAKLLNEVVNLEEMDVATEIVNKEVAEIRAEYNVKTKSLNKYEEEQKELQWVTSAVQDSNGIIEIKNDIDGMELSKRDISKILAEIYSLQQELDLLPDTSIIPVITAIQDLDTNIYKLEERENEITSIVESLSTLDKELNNTILPDPYYLSKLDAITVEIKALEKKEEALEKLLKDILFLEVELVHSAVTQTKLEKEFTDELKANGICPLCGRKPK